MERWTPTPVHGINVMNNTGSTVLSLLDLGFTQLGGWSNYLGYAALTHVTIAAGEFEALPSFSAQVRLVQRDASPRTANLAAQHAILEATKGYERQLLLRLESLAEADDESDCSNPSVMPAANNVVREGVRTGF